MNEQTKYELQIYYGELMHDFENCKDYLEVKNCKVMMFEGF